jgi:hypothetical protein
MPALVAGIHALLVVNSTKKGVDGRDIGLEDRASRLWPGHDGCNN